MRIKLVYRVHGMKTGVVNVMSTQLNMLMPTGLIIFQI